MIKKKTEMKNSKLPIRLRDTGEDSRNTVYAREFFLKHSVTVLYGYVQDLEYIKTRVFAHVERSLKHVSI